MSLRTGPVMPRRISCGGSRGCGRHSRPACKSSARRRCSFDRAHRVIEGEVVEGQPRANRGGPKCVTARPQGACDRRRLLALGVGVDDDHSKPLATIADIEAVCRPNQGGCVGRTRPQIRFVAAIVCAGLCGSYMEHSRAAEHTQAARRTKTLRSVGVESKVIRHRRHTNFLVNETCSVFRTRALVRAS